MTTRSNSNILVSVIVPTYRDSDVLGVCLSHLGRQTLDAASFEVIVVNNAPDERVELGDYGSLNVRVIEESLPGSYAARNKGIDEAKGEILAFTDSDCQPTAGWLENGVSAFLPEAQSYSLAGGAIDLFAKSTRPTVIEVYDMALGLSQETMVVEKKIAVTANLFVRKAMFSNVGQFNSTLFSGGDIEWTQRAHDLGHDILYMPNAIVKHPARSKWRELSTQIRRHTGGQFSQGERSWRNTLPLAAKSLLPPVSGLKFIFDLVSISIVDRVKVFCVYYLLKLVKSCEYIRLQLGSKPERR